MLPVKALKLKPYGNDGEIENVIGDVPDTVGTKLDAAFVGGYAMELTSYARLEGAMAFVTTEISNVTDDVPAVLLISTVYVVDVLIVVGVPEITPLELDNDKPLGNDGVTWNVYGFVPVATGVVVNSVPTTNTIGDEYP